MLSSVAVARTLAASFLSLAVGLSVGLWLGRRSAPAPELAPAPPPPVAVAALPPPPLPPPASPAPPAAAALDARERELDLRERAVAAREAALDRRGKAPAPARGDDSPPHTRREVEALHRRVLDDLETKGLLRDDLPPEARPLDDEIYAAMKAGDFERAGDLTVALGRAVAAVQVDEQFLDAKLKRLSSRRRDERLSPDGSAQVDALLEEATSLAADGQYGSANRRINRIAALLP